MKVGFYERNITPPLGIAMEGYFIPRPSQGVRDELYVKAVALETDVCTAAIISMDIIDIPDGDFCETVYSRIEKYCPALKRENVIMSATHSHTSGATVHGDELSNIYIDMLALQVADAAVLAWQRLEDMKISYACGNGDGLSFVRNYLMDDGTVYTNPDPDDPSIPRIVEPYGKADHDIPILYFDDAEGKPKGCIINFACHHDTVGGRLACSDYSGAMSKALKEEYGPDFVPVFLNGPCGNIADRDRINGDVVSDLPRYIRIGRAIADQVRQCRAKAEPVADILGADCKLVTLKRREIDPAILEDVSELVRFNARVDDFDSGMPKSITFRIATAPAMYRKYCEEPPVRDYPVNAIRIGDCAIYSIPGEVFSQYGDAIKEGSPTDKNFIAELAGVRACFYIPATEVYQYETVYENHPISRCVEDEAGNMIADAAVGLGKKLFEK